MLKKLIQPCNLTGISDDEIYYQGERFIESLTDLLNEYKIFFGSLEPFRQLERNCNIMYKQLKAEEKIVI